MSVKEFSLQLFELGVYHKLENINSFPILTVDDEELSPEEAHILHTLIPFKNHPETAVIALRLMAEHIEVNPVRIGNLCIFQDFKD
jgi:predicted GNAT family N-acyltransferase